MKHVGFIGYGSMGSMLVKAVMATGLVTQEQIIVTRKDKSRLKEINSEWPDMKVTEDVTDIAKNADYIFICVKPFEYPDLLKAMKPYVRPEKHLITIAGSVMLDSLEQIIPCKITKMLPTVASEVNEGITLICHNDKVKEVDADNIKKLLNKTGNLWMIDEKNFDFASELTSCGPGFIAAIFEEFVEAGCRYTNSFTKEQMAEMLLQTVFATARVMMEKEMGFDDVVARVATKGGITEEGVKSIHSGMPRVFDEVLQSTMAMREVVNSKMLHIFSGL